jgi:hypothetical protein
MLDPRSVSTVSQRYMYWKTNSESTQHPRRTLRELKAIPKYPPRGIFELPGDAIRGAFFATPSPGISKEILGLGISIILNSNLYEFKIIH